MPHFPHLLLAIAVALPVSHASQAWAQDTEPPAALLRVAIEPLIGTGAFAGAGAFGSNLNIQAAPVYGGRLTVGPATSRLALYAEYIRSDTEERPPSGCANEFCAQLRGDASLTFWSVGAERTWSVLPSGRGLFAQLSAGLGRERLETHRNALPNRPRSRTTLAIGAATEYQVWNRAALRFGLADYLTLVSTSNYGVGLNSHLSARASVRLFFPSSQ